MLRWLCTTSNVFMQATGRIDALVGFFHSSAFTNLFRLGFSELAPYADRVCWFSTLLREVFFLPGMPVFLAQQQLLIWAIVIRFLISLNCRALLRGWSLSTFFNIIRFRGIAEAATKQASRESKRVTRGQPVPATCGRVFKRKLTAVSLWSRWNQKTLLARLFHQRLHVLAIVFSQGSEFSSPYYMRNRTFSFKSGVLRMFRWPLFSIKTSLLIGNNYNQTRQFKSCFCSEEKA